MRVLRDSLLKTAVAALVVLSGAGSGSAADVPAETTSTGAVNRPTLLVNREELGAVRDALTTDTYRRGVYEESIKAVADDWVSRSITIPPRSGYYHDFACTDGTRLVWPEELRHGEAITSGTRYRCPACESTYASEKLDGAVRYLQHVSLMVAARDLALVGSIENDDRYLRKGAEILNKYADAYPGRHTAAVRGGILYQSLDEAVHFIFLAQAYDLLVAANQLTLEQQKTIETKLLLDCAVGLIACGTGGNWGSWHLSCVGVIGFATGNQRLIDYGITHFKKQMAEQLGDDGLWPESVHTYHFYPMRGFLQLAEAARAHGINLYEWEAKPGKGLKAMYTQPIPTVKPAVAG